MRIVIAGIIGAIAMFIWTSIAHIALPLGAVGLSQIPNEKAVLSVMQSSIGTSPGLYIFPWVNVKSSDAMAQAEAKMKVNPSGLLVYRPPGASGMTARMLIVEFLKQAVVSIIAAFLLAQTVLISYAARAGFVALIGIAAGLTTNVSYWNWYGFPGDYTAAYAGMDIIGYIVAGLAIAAILKRRVA